MERLYRKAQKYVEKFRHSMQRERVDPDGFPAYLVQWALERGKDPTQPLNLNWRWRDYVRIQHLPVTVSLEEVAGILPEEDKGYQDLLALHGVIQRTELTNLEVYVLQQFLLGYTHSEVAEELGVTPSYISQIHHKVIHLLQGGERGSRGVFKDLFQVTRMVDDELSTSWEILPVA